MHRKSKACKSKQAINGKGLKRAPESSYYDLRTFFKPCAPLNSPTLPPSHTDEKSFSGVSDNLGLDLEMSETHKRARHNEAREASKEMLVEMGPPLGTLPMEVGKKKTEAPCPKAIFLLNKLEAAVTRIPNNVPMATPAHRLSTFSVDPCSWIASLEQNPEVDFGGDSMVLNLMLKTAFGSGELEEQENMKVMLNRGKHGLDGFIEFCRYFVLQRGLEGAFIEPKIEGLLREIDNQ